MLWQTAGWIKVSLGTEVGLGPGNIMLDGDPAPPTERSTAAPAFRPMSVVAKRSPISAIAELLFHIQHRRTVFVFHNTGRSRCSTALQ